MESLKAMIGFPAAWRTASRLLICQVTVASYSADSIMTVESQLYWRLVVTLAER